jgi:hypothetical protein
MEILNPESPGQGLAKREANVEVASTRAAQEVQAAMVIAKKFPRDVNAAYTRILQGCKRKALAEQSAYAFPRGGTKVTGPSIRLAEHLAQNWGNFESGVIELERREDESSAMAYAWDLETNSRDVKVFTVKHIRDRQDVKGGAKQLTDQRDIYELLANQGARRKRACILALIPGDIVDAAEAECDKTLKGDNTEPLIDRVRKMASAFMEIGVTTDLLEKRLGHILDATDENELVVLRKIFVSLRDGMSKREDWFTQDPSEQPTGKQGFGFKKATEDKPKEKVEEKKADPKSSGRQADAGNMPANPGVEGAAATPPDVSSDDAALAAEARAREEAEAAQQQAPQQTQFSEPTSTARPPAGAVTPSNILQDLTKLGKEKGISMFDLSGFATKQYSHALPHCSTLELQSILAKVREHPKGQKFQ